jgi:hypothetical protein
VPDGSVSSTSTAFCPGVMLFATVARAKMSLRHMLYRCPFARTCPRVLSRGRQSNSRPSSRRGGAGVQISACSRWCCGDRART